MHAGGADRLDCVDVLMRHDERAKRPPEFHEIGEKRATLGCWQILLAQAEPAAAAAKGGFGNLGYGPARLNATGDHEQRRIGEVHREDFNHVRGWPSNSSASIVTRTTASPGSATGGAPAAIAAPPNRGTGRPSVSALPTRRSR